MIVDVPNADSYRQTAVRFLSIAWEAATKNHLAEGIAEVIAEVPLQGEDKKFLDSSRDEMLVALTLLHSGVDHLLMSRICDVSPYLLLRGRVSDWPKGSRSKDVPFADFHTIDSQDLPKVYDTVCASRLPSGFIAFIDRVRRERNAIAHSIPQNLAPEARHIIEGVLYSTHVLIGYRQWPKLRLETLTRAPQRLVAYNGAASELNGELSAAVKLLSPKAAREWLGVDKRRRRYLCPSCISDAYESEWDTQCFTKGIAQLQGKGTSASRMVCYACDAIHDVVRRPCNEEDCKGNVLADVHDEGFFYCMTCGAGQE